MHIHILGICGTFMGGLALLARSAGHQVTGCDAGVYPPMSTQLQEQGIELIEGFGVEQLELNPDLFVVGNVVARGNPLMEAILERGLPYTSGPQWLGDHILRQQHVLAVAGTHGKTTTSSMLAWILKHAGLRPNFLIGGIAPDLEVSAHFDPQGEFFVIEADEYDTAFFDKRSKFVHYHARTAILHNLEFDHADIFPDLEAIETQFHHFVRTLPGNGAILRPQDSPALDRVLQRGCWTPVIELNTPQGWHYTWSAEGALRIHHGSQSALIDWQLQGEHNAQNALAAIAASHQVGVSLAQACAALSDFQGIKRRLELRGTAANIEVYDDFAHHPTAIATTLKGVRKNLTAASATTEGDSSSGRVIAVFEPRSNTMRDGALVADLPAALDHADLVFCYQETKGKHALKWDAKETLASLGARLQVHYEFETLAQAIAQTAAPADKIIVMSNGHFGNIHERILQALKARFNQ
ncbi:MAG TPA: UDP-N-acetylmuramate:L-alanyl-gamma-D-glutamyl-meso-diaminopimelate ligase [Paenalcaligenes sp.]|nr:UDP-N-acetylmuramate:L-alanyl-gamma-D-glutamyl-meso-diaminopimelate ligase [Paenalcaligenes sp.]